MLINAIRYRSAAKGDDYQIWRFSQGTGKYQNFFSFYGSPEQIDDLISAIQYAMLGSAAARIKDVAVHLSDDSGNTWVVERQTGKIKILRNAKLLEGSDAEAIFQAAVFDDHVSSATQEQKSKVLNHYRIGFSDSHLIANPISADTAGLSKVRSIASQQEEQLAEKVVALLEQPLLRERKRLVDLVQKVEPLYNESREIIRQRRTLLASSSSFEGIDASMVERLQHEVEILEELEVTAKPLLTPGVSPKAIKEKLMSVEEELTKGLAKCNLDAVPISSQGFSWHKLTTALSKVEAYEKLIAASEKARQLGADSITPIYELYVSAIEKLISSDSQITAELDSCFSTLNLHLGTAAKVEEKKKTLTKMVSDFIHPKAQLEAAGQSADQKQGILDNSRMAIDYALGRLGELHSNIAIAKTDFEAWRTGLQDAHEAIVAEYGKLKAHWSSLAKENNLPETMALTDLLQLLTQYSYLVELRSKRNLYRTTLAERKDRLQRLEQLVMEWFRISGSQKTKELSSASILLAEAHGILRYKTSKGEQLAKLRELGSQSQAFFTIKSNIEGRQVLVQSQWRKAFDDLATPLIAPENSHWPQVFRLVSMMQAWQAVVAENAKPLTGARIFAQESCDAPITLFQWSDKNITNPQRLEMLGLVEANATDNLQILLVGDQNLHNMMSKLGVGRLMSIAKPLPAAKTAPAKPAPNPREERIQSAMNVLKTKSGKGVTHL